MTTIDILFPEITRNLPNDAQLDCLPVAQRKFVRNCLHFICKANLLTPFLKQRISQFMGFEFRYYQKTGIRFINFELRKPLWDLYNKITDNKNCSFKKFLKYNNIKLKDIEYEYSHRIATITKPLFNNGKNPNNTRNVEITSYLSTKFRYNSCINAFLDRINFKLNFEKSSIRGLAQPIVISSSKYLLPLNRLTTEEFKTARIYYKDLLKKYFSQFFARIEVGVKSEGYDEQYNGIIHCHAFVKPEEYENFLKQAKVLRAQCRKDGIHTELFNLKVKKLVKKQECQSAQEFVEREFDYACKFSVLEGCVSSDFYKAKTTRTDFSRYFKNKNKGFIENVIQKNYRRSLICRNHDNDSFKENRKWYNTHSEFKNDNIKLLLKIYRQLLRLKREIKTTKTPALVQHTDSKKQVKIEQTTWPKSSKFAKTLQYFKRIILPPLRKLKPKPPD